MSNLINKAKEALSGNKSHDSSTNDPHYDNPQSTTAGPHSSNLVNKGDPRVDSDRDHRNDPTSRQGGYGNTQTSQTGYGNEYGSGTGSGAGAGYGSGQGVGHQSGIGNEYGSGVGAGTGAGHHAGTGIGHGTAGTSGTTGGYGSSNYDNAGSANTGPHNSSLLNKMDPRVDSDRDHRSDPTSRVGGYGDQQQSAYSSGPGIGNTHGGASGIHSTTTTGGATHGEHRSNIANQADPRIDSDHDGSRTYGGGAGGVTGGGYGSGHNTSTHGQHTGHHGTGREAQEYASTGSGNTKATAGPHGSDLLNKLDPRVDSDLSGGKTYGGDATRR